MCVTAGCLYSQSKSISVRVFAVKQYFHLAYNEVLRMGESLVMSLYHLCLCFTKSFSRVMILIKEDTIFTRI